jgi:hypothetical protein
MLRTLALSTVLTGAPIIYVLQNQVAPRFTEIALALLIPTALILLISHTKKRARKSTLDILIDGHPTFDRVISELEARAAQRENRQAR